MTKAGVAMTGGIDEAGRMKDCPAKIDIQSFVFQSSWSYR